MASRDVRFKMHRLGVEDEKVKALQQNPLIIKKSHDFFNSICDNYTVSRYNVI